MPSIPVDQPRTRSAALALAALTVVAVGVSVGVWMPAAGAQPTTSRTRTTFQRSTTTVEDPEPTRPPETAEPRPRSTRPATTAPRTTRRSGAGAGAVTTTFPTMPSSTVTPNLLVPGPNNTMLGPQQASAPGRMSASSALRWVIIGLVVIGLTTAGLTIAYWRHTRPGRGEPGPAEGTTGDGDPMLADTVRRPAPPELAGSAGDGSAAWDVRAHEASQGWGSGVPAVNPQGADVWGSGSPAVQPQGAGTWSPTPPAAGAGTWDQPVAGGPEADEERW